MKIQSLSLDKHQGYDYKYLPLHPGEELELSKVVELSFQSASRLCNVYNWQCYVCSVVHELPNNMSRHFKKNHPTEVYDQSKIIRKFVKTIEKPLFERGPELKPDFRVNTGDFECPQCHLRSLYS